MIDPADHPSAVVESAIDVPQLHAVCIVGASAVDHFIPAVVVEVDERLGKREGVRVDEGEQDRAVRARDHMASICDIGEAVAVEVIDTRATIARLVEDGARATKRVPDPAVGQELHALLGQRAADELVSRVVKAESVTQEGAVRTQW